MSIYCCHSFVHNFKISSSISNSAAVGNSRMTLKSSPLQTENKDSQFRHLLQWIKRKTNIWRSNVANIVLAFVLMFGGISKASCTTSCTTYSPSKENGNSITKMYNRPSPAIPDVEICTAQIISHGKSVSTGTQTSATKVKTSNIINKKKYPEFIQKIVVKINSQLTNHELFQEVRGLWVDLLSSLNGPKLDSLILLLATSGIIPLFKLLNTSPILGFLMTGTLLGPCGLNWVRDVHMIDMLGELGIVFFLFEMGLELSLDRLISMRKDVFGLGTCQFLITSVFGALFAKTVGLSAPAAVTIGGSLALSSSAFVLQLLKDKDAMGTRHGRASFGILLLQDIAVVPLLVVVELLAKGGGGIGRALLVAGAKAAVTLSTMSFIGRSLLDKVFYIVAKSGSHEAFLSSILASVLMMSFLTQGIGLSNTLGAFLAGLLLSETRYKYQIEADIAPFRGLLLGFFFLTVGFSIDGRLLLSQGPLILGLLITLIVGKASIITSLCMAFGMPLDSAQQCGLLNSQGGEFAFVAFGMAERMGLLSKSLSKILLTTVALSMALTPYLADLAAVISKGLERKQGFTHYLGEDSDALAVKAALQRTDHVFVCGYGRVGKTVCKVLDRMLVPYIALDASPQVAIDARNRGLSVFYGDATRSEILKKFDAGSAKACVIAIGGDMTATNKAVIALRRAYPDIPLLVRAKDKQHQIRLGKMFDNIQALSPVLPDDSMLLTLPFGGAVLQTIGYSAPEVDAIMEEFKEQYLEECLDDCSFMRTLDPQIPTASIMTDSSVSSESVVLRPSESAGGDAESSQLISEYLNITATTSTSMDEGILYLNNSESNILKSTYVLDAPEVDQTIVSAILEDLGADVVASTSDIELVEDSVVLNLSGGSSVASHSSTDIVELIDWDSEAIDGSRE